MVVTWESHFCIFQCFYSSTKFAIFQGNTAFGLLFVWERQFYGLLFGSSYSNCPKSTIREPKQGFSGSQLAIQELEKLTTGWGCGWAAHTVKLTKVKNPGIIWCHKSLLWLAAHSSIVDRSNIYPKEINQNSGRMIVVDDIKMNSFYFTWPLSETLDLQKYVLLGIV